MARRLTFHAAASIKLDPSQFPRDEHGNLKPLSLCACGLSQRFPLCDGSHKRCKDERPGVLYEYDPATLARREIAASDTPQPAEADLPGPEEFTRRASEHPNPPTDC